MQYRDLKEKKLAKEHWIER